MPVIGFVTDRIGGIRVGNARLVGWRWVAAPALIGSLCTGIAITVGYETGIAAGSRYGPVHNLNEISGWRVE